MVECLMLSVFHAPECIHAEWVNAQLHAAHCFPLQRFFGITFSVVVKVKMEILYIIFLICTQTLIDSSHWSRYWSCWAEHKECNCFAVLEFIFVHWAQHNLSVIEMHDDDECSEDAFKCTLIYSVKMHKPKIKRKLKRKHAVSLQSSIFIPLRKEFVLIRELRGVQSLPEC